MAAGDPEEASLLIHGDESERAQGAEYLDWMYWKTHIDSLQEFCDLNLESEDHWDTETRGPINLARVKAAERLLRAFDIAP